jgi:hypothetical protein
MDPRPRYVIQPADLPEDEVLSIPAEWVAAPKWSNDSANTTFGTWISKLG